MKCKLSIYLAKKGFTQDSQILDLEHMKAGRELNIPSTESVIYIHQPKPAKHADWIDYILFSQKDINLEDFSKSQSESAVIVCRICERIFLIPFGNGHHKIRKDLIERDFGLRITLNSVEPDKLRSLDKSNYQDNPLNTRNQSTKEVDILSLNIDSELEILSTLTGKSNVPLFGDIVTGRDSLTIIVSESILSLGSILSEALIKFKAPLPKNFEWIDNISKVKDKEMCSVLDLELDELLKHEDKHHEFWLGEPEIIDWESQIGYSFDPYKKSKGAYQTLSFFKLKEYLNKKDIPFCCDSLKTQKIYIVSETESTYKWWSAYNCLYAEVETNGELYILRNNTWYSVNGNFLEKIDQALEKITLYDYNLPIYNHDREDEYNTYATENDDSLFKLDKKLIPHGGAHSKIEFADIVRNGSEFIHVKCYRSSSSLSHLFSQGYVSAELFISDMEFREKLNKLLPDSIKIKNTFERPDSREYTIVYAIATNKDLPKKLPLFSKITLKNAHKALETLGFKVKIYKIEVNSDIEKTIRCKKGK
ncbi:TIGR04141 family sporadically distributed protein [Pectobacterium odoriferum]|uniref:TIGR04141 family sporadically distributed protein n=1 Tax=Pectobacterium odoriferum TaxID=78398 RepID=UPI000CD2A395|nr:TIGR04141 family sporadically distributed protein [Pectobacterium odoriferum]POE05383.1 hypothetical protein BV916_07805 [Pectobacterium odoriferum]